MAPRSGKNTDPYPAAERVRPVSVARAFQASPSAHREILTETVLRERSVNETAVSLGIPVDVVKIRVYHALRALRVALDTPEPGRYGTGQKVCAGGAGFGTVKSERDGKERTAMRSRMRGSSSRQSLSGPGRPPA